MVFRDRVKALVEDVIRRMPNPCDTPVTQESPYWSLFMAFEHERIHLETSSVLIHQLPIDAVAAPQGWRTAPSFAAAPEAAPANALVEVSAGTAVLGKPRAFPSFGWDNEYGAREVAAPAFAVSKYLVSNAEFLPFVLAGGYEEKRWWISPNGDDEGWRWRSYRNATHPSFWVATSHPDQLRFHGGKPGLPFQKDDGHARAGTGAVFRLRTIFDIVDMPWDWPVETNYHESHAFLRWKAATEGAGAAYRMPTEAEFHLCRADPSAFPAATTGRQAGAMAGRGAAPVRVAAAADGKSLASTPAALQGAADGGDDAARVDVVMQDVAPGNVNMRWHSSTPVDMYGPSAAGVHDTHGNVWQWSEDHFAPLPGYEIHYMYDDFSAPCFDGWHTVILGGSWVSTGDLASSFARYHFRRHFFQHLGFRYVRLPAAGAPEPYPGAATVMNLWEGMSSVSADLTNAYARPEERLAYAADAVEPTAAMEYAPRLASLVAATYEAARAGDGSIAPAGAGGVLPPAAAARVLHLGCGVGGGTLELARVFGSVVGVDAREPAVRHARVMQHHGQFEYERVREGVLTDTTLVRTPAGVDRSRASYFVGDAAALGPEVTDQGPFDVVVLDGLLTRLQQPLDVVSRLREYVRPGGLLVVSSNNDWQPSITPRNSWTGGFLMNGEEITTLDMLKYHLKKGFALRGARDVARLQRRHARRFVLDVMEVSQWQRLREGQGCGPAPDAAAAAAAAAQ
jgi:formylglycine-generating enzyme required for sulfatase activity/2-polyprenyl-3-methyl-5-hydroxy-6-metoxy-1,4-benzoquinol methylase